MLNKINRRDFLKAATVTSSVLLAGDILSTRSFAQGAIKIPKAEKITITIITDNYYDALRPDYKIAKRFTPPLNAYISKTFLHAEHGLAYHVETVVNDESHNFLFDYGLDFQGVKRNVELLGIDFTKLEALGLSHDHMDHQGALVDLLKAKREEMRRGIPFYVGEQTFVGTYMRRPDGSIVSLGMKREEIESLGFVKIVEINDPTPIIPGAYFVGKIEQVTDYEKIPPVFLAKKGNDFVQETFIGEQAVILNVKGKGLVVLSGCAHRGIINTVRQGQKMTGIEKVHAVIGGFHLIGAKPELVQRTIADFKVIAPDYIVPTHCTGFEAITAFAREMPDQFIINTVGTKYIFAGSEA